MVLSKYLRCRSTDMFTFESLYEKSPHGRILRSMRRIMASQMNVSTVAA